MFDIYEYQKEYWNTTHKEYYQLHKEELQSYMKTYRVEHIFKVKETEKRYRIRNKEERYKYTKEWSKQNYNDKKELYNKNRRLKYKLNKEK